jgi:TRAP-type C4-dicarboxylate transport system substrate-binding protein
MAAMVLVMMATFAPALKAAEIKLKGITPWPQAYYWTAPFFKFQKMVDERLAGKLSIEYLGGKEVVPTFEQFEGLRNGVVDVILGATSYYTGQVPEATAILYTKRSPSELRNNGFYDLMRELHMEKGNVVYLANVGGGVNKAFRMYSNKKLTKPDFSGMKIRVSPVYVELVKALGGTPIILSPSEIHSAMERGVVDGYGWSYGGISDFGWQEVTKYAIDHAFYSANTSILINGDAWKKLPADIRAELESIGKDLEKWADGFMDEANAKDNAKLLAAGVEMITFSDTDAKTFIKTAYSSAWAKFLEDHPDLGPKIKALTE